jgi:Flp pilus assembly protein CpaB
MAATIPLTPSRALRRPRRLDMRALLGMFIMLATLGGSILVWSSATTGRDVLVAANDLPAGATLAAADLLTVSVRVDPSESDGLIPATQLHTLVGRTLREPVARHAFLSSAVVTGQPALGRDEMELTIPVTAQTALDGRLQPGDTVAVLSTENKGTRQAQTTVLIDQARVREVGYDPSSASDSTSTPTVASPAAIHSVTLLLTRTQAIEVARAKWNGELDVARVTPPEGGQQP